MSNTFAFQLVALALHAHVILAKNHPILPLGKVQFDASFLRKTALCMKAHSPLFAFAGGEPGQFSTWGAACCDDPPQFDQGTPAR
jgi:hypothetical protein